MNPRLKIHLSFQLSLFIIACSVIAACNSKNKPTGEILIRNDIQDSDYNSIVVDQIVSSQGASSMSKKLDPGDEIALPQKGITSLRFTRAYRDFSRVYHVRCPAKKDTTLLKLIDVHLGRMQGGCVLTKKGETRGGMTRWE